MQPVISPRMRPTRWAHIVLAAVAVLGVPLSLLLAFTYAQTNVIPLVGAEASGTVQQDWAQKIFYLHVPIAFAAYLGFFTGAWNGLLFLLRERPEYDLRSYVGVHVGMVFGTLVLLTGSIWAKAAWGVWWHWNDRQLIVFVILYLFYAAYFMLRFSLDAGPLRARASAVYAVVGVVLVPLSFLAIRIAGTLIHPIVIEPGESTMTREMALVFLLSTVSFLALAAWMMQLEATVKVRAMLLRRIASSPPGATPSTGVGTAEGDAGEPGADDRELGVARA